MARNGVMSPTLRPAQRAVVRRCGVRGSRQGRRPRDDPPAPARAPAPGAPGVVCGAPGVDEATWAQAY